MYSELCLGPIGGNAITVINMDILCSTDLAFIMFLYPFKNEEFKKKRFIPIQIKTFKDILVKYL